MPTLQTTSDGTIIPAPKVSTTSDGIVSLTAPVSNQVSVTSDATVVAASSSGNNPSANPKGPANMPSIFAHVNPTCVQSVQCPGTDFPITNASSEAPDAFSFVSINFGPVPDDPPTCLTNCDSITPTFTATGCLGICVSTISQEDADLCAIRQQAQCVIDSHGPPPPPPTITPPPPTQTFGNNPQSCSFTCPDGSPFAITVPAGAFIAVSQILADREAHSYACRQAALRHICLSSLQGFGCPGSAYSSNVVASGNFIFPQFWAITSGTLPPGLNFAGGFRTDGKAVISGTPTTSGNFVFTVTCTNNNGDFMAKQYTICVVGITPTTLPSGTQGGAYSQTLTVPGCSPPVAWSVTSGALPPGLSLNASSGLLSGTISGNGTFNFTITVTSGLGSCSQAYTLVVIAICVSVHDAASDAFFLDGGLAYSVDRNAVLCLSATSKKIFEINGQTGATAVSMTNTPGDVTTGWCPTNRKYYIGIFAKGFQSYDPVAQTFGTLQNLSNSTATGFSFANNKAYCLDGANTMHIWSIDPTTDTPTMLFTGSGGDNYGFNTVYFPSINSLVGCGNFFLGSKFYWVFNLTTNTMTTVVTALDLIDSGGVAFDSKRNRVWFTNLQAGPTNLNLVRYDVASSANTPEATINLSDSLNCNFLTYDSVTDALYFMAQRNSTTQNTLTRVNCSTGAFGYIDEHASGIFINPALNNVIVANSLYYAGASNQTSTDFFCRSCPVTNFGI